RRGGNLHQNQREEARGRFHLRADSAAGPADGTCGRDRGRRSGNGRGENEGNGSRWNSCREESGGNRRRDEGLLIMKTFTILKPDTLKARNAGAVISRLEHEGFRSRAMKMLHLTQAQAEGFYYVHKERPFFPSLVKFMTEGPVILMVLEADNAIDKLRKVM